MMFGKVTAITLLALLGAAGTVASVGATDPPALTVTVTQTRTETVRRLQSYQGKSVRWWAWRAQYNRRRLNQTRAALRKQVRLGSSGLERAFLCIHAFEGSWDDPHAPYWGGLQMDMSFMRSYAPEFLRAYGTADRWTPAMQIATAMRAYLQGRGFYPWPNTARFCGLL